MERKMAFHPDKFDVMSVTQNKNPIKMNYTILGHPLKSLENGQLSWYSNQKKK